MNEELAALAAKYSRDQNLQIKPIDYKLIRCDARIGKRIAAAYQKAPLISADALPAYRAMRDETLRQLDYLMTHVTVEVTQDDPYHHADELQADLTEGRLRVWSTAAGDNPHPVFTDDDNDAFRAVHDAFGHGSTGRGFDVDGEEAAWIKHSQMYSPLARQAMTTETRGQTCEFVYGNGGRFFSVQKAFILPREFWA